MANRQADVDLREAQVSAPKLELWLGWLGLTGGHLLSVCTAIVMQHLSLEM